MTSDEPVAARTGRPKSEEKRAAILEAAGTAFLEKGLEGTSMDAVAQQAGVSKQTVYSHFGSKEELFEAVILNKCKVYDLDQCATEGDDFEAGLLQFTRRFIDLKVDPDVVAMTRQVVANSVEHPDTVALYRQAGIDRSIDGLTEALENARAKGIVAIESPREAAKDYVYETAARYRCELLMNLREDVPAAEREAQAKRCVRNFLREYGTGSTG